MIFEDVVLADEASVFLIGFGQSGSDIGGFFAIRTGIGCRDDWDGLWGVMRAVRVI